MCWRLVPLNCTRNQTLIEKPRDKPIIDCRSSEDQVPVIETVNDPLVPIFDSANGSQVTSAPGAGGETDWFEFSVPRDVLGLEGEKKE